MKIVSVDVFPLSLPMKRTFRTAGGVVGDKNEGAPHLYVRLRSESGLDGWGEARPSHRWSYETLESAESAIRKYIAPQLIGRSVYDLPSIRSSMNKEIAGSLHPGQPIAKAAVDTALYDLAAKAAGLRLNELWLSPPKQDIRLSYLISTTDPKEAEKLAAAAAAQGYEGLDVKIGLRPELDADIIHAAKQAAPQLFFRVDANQAYDYGQALKIGRVLERAGADVFEQPLKASDLHGHAALRRKLDLPIALDESIWTPRDVMHAIRAEACDTVVIKLTKMGGFTGAKLCGEIAAETGLGLLGGGLTESGLGLTASARLFQYLNIQTPVDLNGPMFLADDPLANGPVVENGKAKLPDGLGIGCTIAEDKLTQYGVEITQ